VLISQKAADKSDQLPKEEDQLPDIPFTIVDWKMTFCDLTAD